MKIEIARPEHAEAINTIYAPHIETGYSSFEEEVPTTDEMAQRIVKTLVDTPWLVMTDNQHVAGYAYANKHRWRAAYRWTNEVSVYVDPVYHRKSIGKQLYGALFRVLTIQHVHQALAGIVLPNEPSVAFHTSMGFIEVARYKDVGYKFGQWWETLWMQKMLTSGNTPEPVIPFNRLDINLVKAELLRSEGV